MREEFPSQTANEREVVSQTPNDKKKKKVYNTQQ